MSTFRAIDIARWFVAWADNVDAEVSNLKLQKLLYYAQGHYLGATGQPLFGEAIQAWAHGPVVPEIYRTYRDFGRGPIEADQVLDDTFDWDAYKDVEDFLVDVWDRYGALAAWALRERTHREPPWRDAFQDDVQNVVIPNAEIKAFFAARPLTDG